MANREEQIAEAAKIEFQDRGDNVTTGILTSRYGFLLGAKWADSHPNGFINYEPTKILPNKEFIELLKQFPEDANVCIECCNPRAMVYDEENNLIRID